MVPESGGAVGGAFPAGRGRGRRRCGEPCFWIEKRFGAEATIARKFATFRNLTGSIGFGVEDVSLEEGDESKIRAKYAQKGISWGRRSEELDGGFFVKITPALTYDTRDSAINARKGVLARLSLEENIAISGNSFGKLHGMIKKFNAIGKKSTVVDCDIMGR